MVESFFPKEVAEAFYFEVQLGALPEFDLWIKLEQAVGYFDFSRPVRLTGLLAELPNQILLRGVYFSSWKRKYELVLNFFQYPIVPSFLPVCQMIFLVTILIPA